jgi:superfamily II DNA or RNA helicase
LSQLNPAVSEPIPGSIPRVGMLATVRNRHGIVTSVHPFDGGVEGRVHCVAVEYLDSEIPRDDHLVWEREVAPTLLEPNALPDVSGEPPMLPKELQSLVRAAQWGALSPFIDSDSNDALDGYALTAPFHAAVQLEDFQMVPLLKALQMPRVALLLADDVGLGKTIEAGLILTELLIRRRIRRVMVLCPASLRVQWKQELRDKFSLQFDIIDRKSTHALQKRLGLDSNPWRTFSKVITSYDYLKQPDVLDQFYNACTLSEDSARLPWDLLILDEAHNLMPPPYGEPSDLTKMLRLVAPFFEHRLFLTATPHNGYTRSFTGLLECLDPVRFTQKAGPLTDADQRRIEQVVVRRLKSEIRSRAGVSKFAERHVDAINLKLSSAEIALNRAFQEFRKRVRELLAGGNRSEQLAGSFAVEILGKRLLSSTVAFADSWYRYLAGMSGDEQSTADDVRAAGRYAKEDLDDDPEIEARGQTAMTVVGSWLRPLASRLAREMDGISDTLKVLGLYQSEASLIEPTSDSKFDALATLVRTRLTREEIDYAGANEDKIPSSLWCDDERLVVFTEYKTTLDYLKSRLERICGTDGRIRVLFGGMDDSEREEIKTAFNNPSDPVRILIATDAAAEGLNLQETARLMLHYDIPWNPSRLEQRIGRLDRHGQARDVLVYHFTSNDDSDMAFLSRVAQKVNTIREDLGSTGQVFHAAIERRLVQGEDDALVLTELDRMLEQASFKALVPRDPSMENGVTALDQAAHLAGQVGLNPPSMKQVLDEAIASEGNLDSYVLGPQPNDTYRLRQPVPPKWEPIVDEFLRMESRLGLRGAVPSLAFDPGVFVQDVAGRKVFRPRKDTVLLHLGHPVMRQALSVFASRRFPGTGRSVSRWTVTRGEVPDGARALVRLFVEEMATNELRETFHHWVSLLEFGVVDGGLREHRSSSEPLVGDRTPSAEDVDEAIEIWDDIVVELRALLKRRSESLTETFSAVLTAMGEEVRKQENERFRSRQAEVSSLIQNNTIRRLQREIDREKQNRTQLLLQPVLVGGVETELKRIDQSIEAKQEEIRRREQDANRLRELLDRERDRTLNKIIPKRYTLRGVAQVFPVAAEIVLPETGGDDGGSEL